MKKEYVFLIIGVCIVIFGLSLIIWTYFDSIQKDLESSKRVPLQFNLLQHSAGDENNPSTIELQFIFNTDYEFAVGNPFDFVFQAKVGGPPLIDRIFILFESPNINSSAIDIENVDSLIEYAIENDLGVELNEIGLTNDQKILYEREGTYMYPFETDVILFPITLGINGEFGPLDKTSPLFYIKPKSEFLAAKASIEQINASYNQDALNRYNIGLGILAISGVPFGIGTTLLISRRKEELGISKINNQFSNNYLTKTEEIEDESFDEVIILNKGEDQIYSYDLDPGDKIVGEIKSEQPINVFVVSNYGLRLYKKEEDFNFEDGGERIKRIKINFETHAGGPWHVIIENENSSETEVEVYLNQDYSGG